MIRRELGVFLVVGSLTVGVDFLTYRGLLWGGLGYDVAKAIGFLAGTVFAYFANRFWTFGHKRAVSGSMLRFALLYILTLVANVGINTLMLSTFSGMPRAIEFAFLVATGVSATLNFLGMKLYVFRSISPKGFA